MPSVFEITLFCLLIFASLAFIFMAVKILNPISVLVEFAAFCLVGIVVLAARGLMFFWKKARSLSLPTSLGTRDPSKELVLPAH